MMTYGKLRTTLASGSDVVRDLLVAWATLRTPVTAAAVALASAGIPRDRAADLLGMEGEALDAVIATYAAGLPGTGSSDA